MNVFFLVISNCLNQVLAFRSLEVKKKTFFSIFTLLQGQAKGKTENSSSAVTQPLSWQNVSDQKFSQIPVNSGGRCWVWR